MESIPDQSVGIVVKSNCIGRTRYTQQYTQEVLVAFESSSLSTPVFAGQCDIEYSTRTAWLAKRKRGSSKPASAAPTFLVAELASASGTGALEIYLPGGAVVHASDAGQVPCSPNSSAKSTESDRHAHLQRQPQSPSRPPAMRHAQEFQRPLHPR